MASVHDVAAYVLDRSGPLSAMKLEKLVYYCQAWSLVWDDKPLFKARIEAWANGPVVPQLYRLHRKIFTVAGWPAGSSTALSDVERETVDAVVSFYGKRPSQWLSDLTHSEPPWRNARQGIPSGAPCTNEITLSAMAEYYGSLV
jgi:uncharacterized phage-associated protein